MDEGGNGKGLLRPEDKFTPEDQTVYFQKKNDVIVFILRIYR